VTKEQVLADYGGKGFGTFKPALADLTVAKISPIGDEMRRLMADPVEIDKVLKRGADKARSIAGPVLAETKKLVGFIDLYAKS
jgi:tryptophanyl-tRNA synthetase